MATSNLVLDTIPGVLTIGYVVGDPWTRSLVYKEDGEPRPWPEAPVLEFLGTGLSVPATLSADGSVATWNISEAQIAAIDAARLAGKGKVRLSVAGVTWFAGKVNARA